MKYDAAIFDLDGTLVDTLADITSLMNRTLAAMGFPGHPESSYREMIGHGMKRLALLALPESESCDALATKVTAMMIEKYLEQPVVATKPYPGMEKTLLSLAAAGVKLSVVSNKPDALVKPILDITLGSVPFAFLSGAREGVPKKPDPALPLLAALKMGVVPEKTVFVGDSAVDVETGQNAGMGTIAVLWGFRGKEELLGANTLVSKPEDLLVAILGRD